MTKPSADRYIIPKLPHYAIDLEAIVEPEDEVWAVGPFPPGEWIVLDDNTIVHYPEVGRPFALRVRSQEGDVLHANNGDEDLQDYRIVPAYLVAEQD